MLFIQNIHNSLCVRCQQLEQLLVIEAGPDELTPGHPPVIVDIHPLEDPRRPLLYLLIVTKSHKLDLPDLGSPGPRAVPHHLVDADHDAGHLLQVNPPVAVHVIHAVTVT